MSSTLLVQQGKSKLFLTFSGFIIGILISLFSDQYCISYSNSMVKQTVSGPILRIIFAVIMFVLWWLVYFLIHLKEKSILFDTPEKLKEISKISQRRHIFIAFHWVLSLRSLNCLCIGGVVLEINL